MAKKKHGPYYREDSEARHQYFENKFFEGVKLNRIDLSTMTSFRDFKQVLEASFSTDDSLLEYFNYMTETELKSFYARENIQRIVEENKEREEIAVVEVAEPPTPLPMRPPVKVWVTAYRKGVRTRGYRDFVTIRGKRVLRHRDIRGKFVSIKG